MLIDGVASGAADTDHLDDGAAQLRFSTTSNMLTSFRVK